jgi:NAD(P)-dependent dehydrogenase (short-subunit alcohol dehydrogenase family)
MKGKAMKVLVIGGRGVIGSAVVALLSAQHEVLVGGRNGGEVRVDMTDPASIEAMFQAHPDLDAVVVTAGHVPFKPLQQLSEVDWQSGLHDKLMGQVRLVQIGARHLRPGAVFVLTSGLLEREHILGGSCASVVNAGLAAFVRSAAQELWGQARVNLVSPGVVAGDERGAEAFAGFTSISCEQLAQRYLRALSQPLTGKVLEAFAEVTR